MPAVHDLCARIQNGFRAQLRSISVPDKKMNLAICNALYREGFISSVTRGDHRGPDKEFVPNTPENIAMRRLWLELKYRQNESVLRRMSCVSKGSRRVYMNVEELQRFLAGQRVDFVGGLKIGEVAIISTTLGVISVHEAIACNQGGEVLCRIW
ncbi:6996_t:CDS:1 [Paraglomus brasilianum]|uniref:6996_t:CDS:1 n=1 Tax=Paraglomus brasilianum TaxID=144538 RepID=A0A9N8VP13_9GLOM|nr:6996_t:CDS:1 [Paraglomus brasilianum]